MTIPSFCLDQLRICGPLTLAVLAERAADEGVTTARNPMSSVRSAIAHRAVQLGDGRWDSPVRLLEGRVLTTLGQTMIDGLDDEPFRTFPYDLELLRIAAREVRLPFADGGSINCTPYQSLTWPEGLGDLCLGPGELIALRLRQGALHTETVQLTPQLRQAGRLLADALGPLNRRTTPYWSTDLHAVSHNLTRALWDRLAADPEFLTSPLPPLSQCIPALSAALQHEGELQRERNSRWQAHLELPDAVHWVAVRGSELAGTLVPEWLNDFVARSLRELGESYDEERGDAHWESRPQLPFPRRLRSV